jgi:hypothetical protein
VPPRRHQQRPHAEGVQPVRPGQLKVRSNVTLELGLPLGPARLPTETDDRFVYFDAATVSLYQIGQAGPATRSTTTRTTSSPAWGRLGSLQGRQTSVRAAYALLADQPVTNLVSQTAGNPPLVTPLAFTGAAGSIRLDNALAVARAAGLAP